MPTFFFGLLLLFCATIIRGKLARHDLHVNTGPSVSGIPSNQHVVYGKTSAVNALQDRSGYQQFYHHSDGGGHELSRQPSGRVGHSQGHLDGYTTSKGYHHDQYGPLNGEPGQTPSGTVSYVIPQGLNFPHNTQGSGGYNPEQYGTLKVPRLHSLSGGSSRNIESYDIHGGYDLEQYGPISGPTGPALSKTASGHINSYQAPNGGYDSEQYGPIHDQAVHASIQGSRSIIGQKRPKTVKVEIVPHDFPTEKQSSYAEQYYGTEYGPVLPDTKYAATAQYSSDYGIRYGPADGISDKRSARYDAPYKADYGPIGRKSDTNSGSVHLTNRQGRTSVKVNINLRPYENHHGPADYGEYHNRPRYMTVIERNTVPIITFKKIPRVVMKTVQSKVPVVKLVPQVVDLSTGNVIKTGRH